ncbi:hypothetical protein [Nocardia mexicana]|uniref:Uncharacterized protein n=1 Tax=Nocardia mexicana TaxID=279262 RepID=A0A370H4X6_9NOCA|nr:hypothetical protein [Nocardia mexicana]RDI51087.1 hypothetical protein DFR68_105564 [Nocardia mexicana]
MMRKFGVLLAVVTVIATGAYVFVYLYRWEWNRAIMSATLFLAAEIALVAMLVTNRLRALGSRIGAEPERRRTARIVHAAEPPSRVNFAWLTRPERLNVFVPVLLAGGVLLTGIAWVVERVARATAKPAATRGITTRLERLALPPEGFLGPVEDRTRLLRGPLVR